MKFEIVLLCARSVCHRAGRAVVLDVVCKHLSPAGNYLGDYAPIFTPNYRTPWGDARNFDDADSDGVRRYSERDEMKAAKES